MYGERGAALGWKLGVGGGLSGFWDDVYNISSKVATGAKTVSEVTSGQKSVAVVPANHPSITIPGQGMFTGGVGLPSWLIPVGLGVAAVMILRTRPR